ncbi:MAG: hydantoinase/oxoprolinase family protein [Zetaproteobacteria bacterium]|nr:MAG: hydantoinase/oxoprolinase family protein [Zetaproteobacteria bacterium]
MTTPLLLGVDTGGTFTDFVLFADGRLTFHKELSTPDDPARAILAGVAALGLAPERLHLVHGSTVATNAVLERKGVRTLLITNRGMEDLLTIGRQQRRALYRLDDPPHQPWLARDDCLGVGGRVGADGDYDPVPEEDLAEAAARAAGYDAVAVCTLFSFLRPEQEEAIVAALADHPWVSASHRLLAEAGEFARAATTFLNASVAPLVARYLRRLAERLQPRHLFVMHSAGGVMSAGQAGSEAARMVLSGPAGGLVAAWRVGADLGLERLLTFDMGGTSTDVALIDGGLARTTEGSIAGLPLALPMLDIHTIGAGGGSLAWRDAAGLLKVGPRSAGADPGPVCYGRGGRVPTVTDANLLLGRIPPQTRLAGRMGLDRDTCRARMAEMAAGMGMTAEELAGGIVRLAEEQMAGALRRVSVARGIDVRDFTLFCFGGAGGLHACALAEAMEMHRVLVPRASGAFSALGMLLGRRQSDRSRSCRLPLSACGGEALARLKEQLAAEVEAVMGGLRLQHEWLVDLRYRGQGFHLTLPLAEEEEEMARAFHQAHLRAYGHRLDLPVEIITLRLIATAEGEPITLPPIEPALAAPAPCGASEVVGTGRVPCFARAGLGAGCRLSGPALIVEEHATTWLAPGWRLQVTVQGHLLIEHE